jgi:hypothetical protein
MEFRQWLENDEGQGSDGKYWVLSRDLPVMEKKLEKLNRRAAKLKMPPVELKVLGKRVARERGEDGRPYDVERAQVELVGAAPKLKGWTFVARIVHGEGGNMIMGVPDEETPTKYRTAPPACDHCRSNRNRKDTFVVRGDSGEHKQIGTNCLRDFLGTEDPAAYVLYFSELKSLVDDMDGGLEERGGRRSAEVETVDFLATSIAVARKLGFVSRRAADERNLPTTSSQVMRYFFSDAEEFKKEVDSARRPDDRERAEKMIAWARSLKDAGEEGVEQYLWNLSVAAEGLTVDSRSAGLMASLPSAYDRAMGVSSSRPAKEAPPAPTLKAGDKFEGVLTVEKVRSWSTDYGVTTLHVMKDDEGRSYKWKASKESLDEGSRVRIKGSVKAVEPDRYNNNIPTVELTRCKVLGMVMGREDQGMIARKEGLEKEWRDHMGNLDPFWSNPPQPLRDEEVERYALTHATPSVVGPPWASVIDRAWKASGSTLGRESFEDRFYEELSRGTVPHYLEGDDARDVSQALERMRPVVARMKEVARDLWKIHAAEGRYKDRKVEREG